MKGTSIMKVKLGRRIIGIVFLYILASVFISAKAQRGKASAIITGNAQIDGVPVDSVQYNVLEERIFGELGNRVLYAKCDQKGNFNIRIDPLNKIQVLQFRFWGARKIYSPKYYMESGDSIRIFFSADSSEINAFCVGKGAAKYNYAFESRNIGSFEAFLELKDKPEFKRVKGAADLEDVKANYRMAKYNESLFLKVFNKYKGAMSPQIKEVIQDDIIAVPASALASITLQNYFKSRDTSILQFYRSTLAKIVTVALNDISSNSDNLVNYLYTKSRLELNIKTDKINNSIDDIYSQLKADYTGTVRDKLILAYLMRRPPGNESEYTNALEDAITFVHSIKGLKFLKQQLLATRKTSTAFNFSMPDSSGTVFSLEQFRNKVVLIDVWFTYCVPCTEIAKIIHNDIMPSFSKEDQVAFITINVDKSEKLWKDSLKSGLYAGSGSVNLFTEGKGFEHPFIRYYNITSCPTLILVDKQGKIITANPEKNGAALVKLIKETLTYK